MPVIRIPITRNPNYKPVGLKSYVYALNKFGITPRHGKVFKRDAQKKLMKVNDDGSESQVTAANQQNDALFTVPVQIGTPGQTLSLDFDSGSSDLWVWSTELPQNIQQAGKKAGVHIFDPKASSTFKEVSGATWKIQYGDQSSASGTVGTDTIKIGNISVENQAIELANQLSEQFQQESVTHGLLGLAWGSINTVKPTAVKTPVENMIAQEDIPENAELFTCYLGSVKDQQDPDKGQSFYTFGAIDEDVVKASGQQISYTPVDNSQGFWMYKSASATVNGQQVQLPSNNMAIADTGTTLFMASDELCKAVYDQIPGSMMDRQQGVYVFPANTDTARLPKVTVAIGSKQFSLEQEHLAFGPADEGGQYTFGGIQPRGDLPFDIMGDAMLMCLYAVFDVGKKQFGCVQRADPTPAGQ